MQWCNMPTNSAPRISNDEIGETIHRAIEDQHCVGWDNFMKGRVDVQDNNICMVYLLPDMQCLECTLAH
eukprot:15329694-Ditylum_brightwellii.AAC.1